MDKVEQINEAERKNKVKRRSNRVEKQKLLHHASLPVYLRSSFNEDILRPVLGAHNKEREAAALRRRRRSNKKKKNR